MLKVIGTKMVGRAASFLRDTRGVSTVEYALIIVAVLAIVGAGSLMLGGEFKSLFSQVASDIDAASFKTDVQNALT